jgi:ABC-type Mn2+/Zn2+ transport system permease subunit/Mn-dependent DtxR family transcriptional regulator
MKHFHPTRKNPVRRCSRNSSLLTPHSSLLFVAALLLCATSGQAARIADLVETDIAEQAMRFFTFQDAAVRYALLGSLLLGLSCGLLGSFIVVRKLALMGDTLSHAVLPGVAVGFLWNMTKDPVAIFIGATAAGLLGTVAVTWIRETTRIKEDAALGIVLSGFFAVGICLVTMIQQLPHGNKSGIDKFLFGQAAAMGPGDIQLMAVVTALAVAVIFVFYKEFLVTSFDSAFASASGFPVRAIHHVLMLLLAFSVVISLQAVGVVLVSAMLIIPAASAYLLTDRMHRMIWLAALFGMASGAIGAFLSFLGPGLPTGPFMVLSASFVFAASFFFAPRHGVVTRWIRKISRANRIQQENTLKSIYHVMEDRNFEGEGVSIGELASRRNESALEARQLVEKLRRHGLGTLDEASQRVFLTPEGWQGACAIVRNHRLWELYLTNAADVPSDHVHEDAEKIEHVLGDRTIRELERKLDFATRDPHGKRIPTEADIARGLAAISPRDRVSGFGKR